VNVGDVKAFTDRQREILMAAEKFCVEAIDGGGGNFVANDRAVEPFALYNDDGTGLADVGFRAYAHYAFAEFGGLVSLGENLFEDDALIEGLLWNGEEREKEKKSGASCHRKIIEGMARKRKM